MYQYKCLNPISACGTSVAATVILPLLATDAPCAESEDASVADDASDAVSDAEAPALLPDADEPQPVRTESASELTSSADKTFFFIMSSPRHCRKPFLIKRP